jgi:SAM-dependent methyltransferase
MVLDLTAPAEQIDRQLRGMRFGSILCLSVLEHCRQPFLMAQNLARLLRPGGKLCVSVPFAWEFHGYPSDCWRFTAAGVRVLFDGLVFNPDQCVAATSRDREFLPLDGDIGRIPFSTKFHWRRGRYVRGVAAKGLRWVGRCGGLGWLAGYPYVLAPTTVFMIGTRPTSEPDDHPQP